DPFERAFGRGALAENDRERRVCGSQQSTERRTAEGRVLVNAGGDQRVGDLHQDRGRTAEEHERLAVDPTSDAVDREDSGVAHVMSVRSRVPGQPLESSLGVKVRAAELMQYRMPVGSGPSGNR